MKSTKGLKSVKRSTTVVGSAEFKAHCLSLIQHITPKGIVITNHGKPVAKLVPIRSGSGDLIGSLKDKITIKGDVMSTGIRWDAES